MTQRPLLFVTGNKNKFAEAQRITKRAGIIIEQFHDRPTEIQSSSLHKIAQHSCEVALHQLKRPLFVEDAGLFIYQLNGFPGPYSSYVLKTLDNAGILKLMQTEKNRVAVFRSIIAYGEPDREIQLFEGETMGTISRRIRGTEWGFDPIFIPDEGDGATYAEMPDDMKNRISHRAKSLAKFVNWYLTYGSATT
ncbi:MAG: RdgB/HAM1 family non-canonical purine NTP pyrophosphatase [Promethearchaeota archaeon]